MSNLFCHLLKRDLGGPQEPAPSRPPELSTAEKPCGPSQASLCPPPEAPHAAQMGLRGFDGLRG